ncbi:hypothetical protein CBW24_08645 [Pacificitalea manganoxidans]|uniref:Uncharacterized protein n=1 Tax=Pacificitalea manganoxidans TaxID=1411902 RepID=A0A291LZE8_9RHOB|nr:hypothetical protein CBW24_08645 [Pacificitalea manganoxidans]
MAAAGLTERKQSQRPAIPFRNASAERDEVIGWPAASETLRYLVCFEIARKVSGQSASRQTRAANRPPT